MGWVRVARRVVALDQHTISTGPAISIAEGSAKASFGKANTTGRFRLAPAILGLGLWVGFPTAVALQDMTSMIAGADSGAARWSTVVQKAGAGSVQSADMPFVDLSAKTGSIAGGGLKVPGIGQVALTGKGELDPRPDEARITRAEKKGRIIQVAPVAPPKAFSAGSVLDRTSSFLRPALDSDVKFAFFEATSRGKEIQLAGIFQAKREVPKNFGVPDYLVALVNNNRPDILATAYAVSGEPDKTSPFDVLLKADPNDGRFIPPMGIGDHGWLEQVLPASVFSKAEQTCLANAVYFEARGESLRGQAAVAQVVLNRVRNPTYPNTICGVVYQNEGWKNRCQFSFACDGVKDRILSPSTYSKAKEVAMAVTAGKIFLSDVGSSTHYYATYVSPGWARTMKKMTKIGQHIFYRTIRGGWS